MGAVAERPDDQTLNKIALTRGLIIGKRS